MAAPVLQNYQFWFGNEEQGKLFGINTLTDVVSAEGLEAVSVRSGTREYPRKDGAVPGLHTMSQKSPVFELEVVGEEEYESLAEVFQMMEDEEGELHFKYPGREQKFMRARLLGRTDYKDGFIVGKLPLTVSFEVADPRVYGLDVFNEVLTPWAPPVEGADWGFDWDIDFTVSASGGFDKVMHNAGNTKAYPTCRFFGPGSGTCEGVLLRNLTTGVDMEINTTILTGQILTADMSARARGTGARIIDLSGSPRYGDWAEPRITMYLQKGDNLMRLELTGGSTSDDVKCVVNWRNTSY